MSNRRALLNAAREEEEMREFYQRREESRKNRILEGVPNYFFSLIAMLKNDPDFSCLWAVQKLGVLIGQAAEVGQVLLPRLDFSKIKNNDPWEKPWTCCQCGFENIPPTLFENPVECNRCAMTVRKNELCSWHTGGNFASADNQNCYKCRLDFCYRNKQVGLPSSIWKKDRQSYKDFVIYDFPYPPGFIPDHIAKILKTDTERLMFKQAKRFVNSIIEDRNYDNSNVTSAHCMYRLYNLHKGIGKNKFKQRENILRELDEILYHSCEIADEGYGCSMGMMMSHIADINRMPIDISEVSEVEEIIALPDTEEIYSEDDDEVSHIRNIGKKFCSCRTYTEYDTCKHISDIDPNNVTIKEPSGDQFVVNTQHNNCSCTGKKWGNCWHINRANKNSLNKPDTSVPVKGSKGNIYYVEDEKCTCLGFRYNNNCKHIAMAVAKLAKANKSGKPN